MRPTDPATQTTLPTPTGTWDAASADCDAADWADRVGEQAAAWRRNNQARVLLGARRLLAARGVAAPGPAVPDVAFAIVEEAGGTSDPALADLFARLLANHLDPARRGTVHRAYARVLGQMAPADLDVLLALDEDKCGRAEYWAREWDAQSRRYPPTLPMGGRSPRREAAGVAALVGRRLGQDVPVGAVEASLGTLARLGLCADDSGIKYSFITAEVVGWHLTLLAHRLLAACADDAGYWYDPMASQLGQRIHVIK